MRQAIPIYHNRRTTMPVFDLNKYSREDQDRMQKNLKRVGAADDLKYEARVIALQQTVAELLSALEKAGVKTEL
jgi:hypothetical protein